MSNVFDMYKNANVKEFTEPQMEIFDKLDHVFGIAIEKLAKLDPKKYNLVKTSSDYYLHAYKHTSEFEYVLSIDYYLPYGVWTRPEHLGFYIIQDVQVNSLVKFLANSEPPKKSEERHYHKSLISSIFSIDKALSNQKFIYDLLKFYIDVRYIINKNFAENKSNYSKINKINEKLSTKYAYMLHDVDPI